MPTNWSEVTKFFNESIDEANGIPMPDSSNDLEITIFSPALDRTLRVIVPARKVEDFMKNLPLFEANVWNTRIFCNSCEGPYGGWLEQYHGHWDTCPNRWDN